MIYLNTIHSHPEHHSMCQNIHAPFLMALIDIMNRMNLSKTAVFTISLSSMRVFGACSVETGGLTRNMAHILSLFSSTIRDLFHFFHCEIYRVYSVLLVNLPSN